MNTELISRTILGLFYFNYISILYLIGWHTTSYMEVSL